MYKITAVCSIEEDENGEVKQLTPWKEEKYFCPHCGQEVIEGKSINEYFRACNNCDEDFYEFELIKK